MAMNRKSFLSAGVSAVLLPALWLWSAGKRDLPSPEELPGMGQAAVETALLDRERREILRAWGEPDGMLSGFFGDVCRLDGGGHVIVYYDTKPMNGGTAGSNTVPVAHIRFTEEWS